jgi:hypothetical protein
VIDASKAISECLAGVGDKLTMLFRKDHAQSKNLKRDGDSTESHRTFVELLLDDPMRFNEMRADTEARRQTTP